MDHLVEYSLERFHQPLEGVDSGLSDETIATYVRMLQDRIDALTIASLTARTCAGASVDLRCLAVTMQPSSGGAACQILHRTGAGLKSIGSGALVKADLILTAGHVVPAAIEHGLPGCGSLVARFGYERDCHGEVDVAAIVDFDLGFIPTEFRRGRLDYALLRARATPGYLPSTLFTAMTIGSSGTLTVGDALTCIHHPLGSPKQVSTGPCSHAGGVLLRYELHTAFQSSGAPILNASGEIVAVHNAPTRSDPCVKHGLSSDALLAESALL